MIGPESRSALRRRAARLRPQAARLGAGVGARPLVAALVLTALVSLPFVLFPRLDLAVTGLFYAEGDGFSAGTARLLRLVRNLGRLAEAALALSVSLPLLVKLLWPESRLLVRPRSTLFVLSSFALGPGLLVNGLLKDQWGRARPRQLAEFGGEAVFTPAWQIADQCLRNCSFVSGEAASAFWLTALVFLAPRRLRPTVALWTLGAAAAVSYTRIAMGGHFLSDVLIAWTLTLLVLLVLARLLLDGLPAGFDAAAERALGRAGRALRRLAAALRPRSPSL